MIKASIRALKERNGSSKRAIAKYIESVYVPETELNMAIGPGSVYIPVGSGGVAPAARKSPGRPPKAGGEAKKPLKLPTVKPKKPRKPSGKPLERPKKSLWLWRHPYANQGFRLFHRFM